MLTAQAFEDGLSLHFPRGLRDDVKDKAAAARWATVAETSGGNWRYGSKPGMMFLGYRNGERVGRLDDRHQITVGGSRAGKGVSLIIPALLTYEGSVLAIDPKGELARLTAQPRMKRLGMHVVVLDPFGASGIPSQSFNPLAEIKERVPGHDTRWPYAIDDALAIAEALIVQSTGETHWTDSAKSLLQALILMTLIDEPERRNLVAVRDFLMLRDVSVTNRAALDNIDGDTALFQIMRTLYADLFDGVIAGIGAQFLSMGEKERGSILSTARTQTAFLDSPALKATLKRSDFELADLKRQKTTVYLCLPASNMGTHAKWLRTIITLALKECERIPAPPPLPVLFVLDEFAVLGHMRAIESAAGQMAGFGVKLWTVLQDLSQLKHNYQGTWETFFGNAAIATFHGVADMTTLEYLAKRLGTRAFVVEQGTGARHSAVVSGAQLSNETVRAEPLLATHEIELALARERGRMVVLFPGSHPLILQRTEYHKDTFFLERMR